ncbi:MULTISPECIES: DUF6817 domain-containing protein [unclassified Streptomyces]|uniref:DUF6817 domain-containing protein n=1 Tax=unclassified Streptomyces TaxID=2593676 RepID=UPI0019033390|nr:hypothetical protein [Streptomyces sp. HSG2]
MPRPDRPTVVTARADAARELLRELGAETLPHPGGTLLSHLDRVHRRLASWDARPDLRLAGLCHAVYGTDGFAVPLLPLAERARLRAAVGPEAESLVRLYARCDRRVAYAALTDASASFRDRFTGRTFTLARGPREDFAELTAANELDVAGVDEGFRRRWGGELLELFTRLRPLLTPAAWRDCEFVLAAP